MKQILWISASVPYDDVPHAGGKIHNYYLKYAQMHSEHNIQLITFYWQNELEKVDLKEYGINGILLKRAIWGFPRILFNLESFFNPYNRYAGIDQNYTIYQLKKVLKELKKKSYVPDIIILHWTEMLVLIPEVKKFFPNAKVIGVEEDVKFLSFERLYKREKRWLKKYLRYVKYRKLYHIEKNACNRAEKIILNNIKDYNLLRLNGVSEQKLFVWQPFFENKSEIPYIGDENVIIFYGAMSREENWKSAIWFIENVFYKLKNQLIQFYVIGASPVQQLLKYESGCIHIKGFVDDIGQYFSHSMCFVAPLLIGAGIKIKILEAMSAGLPVLTNSIGIEGIPAIAGEDYIHCESAEEYIKAIEELETSAKFRQEISINEKKFIKENFDLERSAQKFLDLLNAM